MNQFSAKLKREKDACMKVKVELIRPYLSVYVVLVDFYLQYSIYRPCTPLYTHGGCEKSSIGPRRPHFHYF